MYTKLVVNVAVRLLFLSVSFVLYSIFPGQQRCVVFDYLVCELISLLESVSSRAKVVHFLLCAFCLKRAWGCVIIFVSSRFRSVLLTRSLEERVVRLFNFFG